MLIRGVNWALDSDDREESDDVRFVIDSMAGDTEVPETLEEKGMDDEVEDAALTLLQLAKSEANKEVKKL